MRTGPPLNPALVVTAARVGLVPLVMILIIADVPGGRWWAAGIYLAAAATDSLDGWLARSRGEVTVAGAFLDPLADKLLVSAALVSLVQVGDLPAWVAMVIIAREFAVTGLRLVAISEELVIPASRFGKLKTVSQNVAIVAVVAPHPWKAIDDPLIGIAVVLTVVSGAYYFLAAQRRLAVRRGPSLDMTGDP